MTLTAEVPRSSLPDLPRRTRRNAVWVLSVVALVVGGACAWMCWPLPPPAVPPFSSDATAPIAPGTDLDPARWQATLWAGPPATVATVVARAPVQVLSLMEGPAGRRAVLDLGNDGVAILAPGETQGTVTLLSIEERSVRVRVSDEELTLTVDAETPP